MGAEIIILGVISFISTNIDDLFINMLFYSGVHNKKQEYKILAGKYLGIGTLVLVSVLSSLGIQLLSGRIITVLGIIPIGMGIKEAVVQLKNKEINTNDQMTGIAVSQVAQLLCRWCILQ